MDDFLSSEPEPVAVLLALAVLGQADEAALAATLGVPAARLNLEPLTSQPGVHLLEGRWAIDTAAATPLLAGYEQQNPGGYRRLHERAVRHLAGRLETADRPWEPVFRSVFDRLASQMLIDDPAGMIALVDAVHGLPLEEAQSQQLLHYFQGVALAKADRYMDALASLDALLAEPALDMKIRARCINSRAVYCRLTGKLEEAAAGYRASLALWEKLDDPLRQGMALHNLGILAYELQEYGEAEKNLAQARRFFSDAGSSRWLAAAQNELGLVYRDQGRWDAAQRAFQDAIDRLEPAGARDAQARALNNLGEVQLFQHQLEAARASFQGALERMETRAYAIDAHLNLGLVRQIQGDTLDAVAAYQQALAAALDIGRRDILAQVHFRLGEGLHRLGDDAGALSHFQAAAEVVEETREALHKEQLKISLLGRWAQVYEGLVLHCLEMGHIAEAFEWAERARARAFADVLAQQQPAIGEGGPRPITAAPATAAELQDSLPEGMSLLCYFTTGVLERDIPLLRALPPESNLQEHLIAPARTLLFVLTKSTFACHTCALDPNLMASHSPRREDRDRYLIPKVLQHLHETLVAPAGDVLRSRQLIFIPHGPLHRVPFAALEAPDSGPVLSASGPQLSQAPSATLLMNSLSHAPPSSTKPSILAIGYNGEARPALRHTEAEANLVARLGDGQAWVGPQPKKEGMREMAFQQRWLHFACHGRFNELDPMQSFLETGAGERLTAHEVLTGWRLQADLVTLSACQTGVSRILRGDEPMGLIRAFLYAGARAILVSQWAVEDLAAFLLMHRFYTGMIEGDLYDPASALQAAQAWLRDLTTSEMVSSLKELQADRPEIEIPQPDPARSFEDRPFAHPRNWAAFILVRGG